MKFVMIREYDWDLSKDKIILGEITENHTVRYENGNTYTRTSTHKLSIAYLLSIGDFDENEEYNILYNTASIQLRPKAIYKNNKGYYKKVDNKRVYFKEDETIEIEQAINKFKKYLGDKYEKNNSNN